MRDGSIALMLLERVLPSSLRACHGALVRLDAEWCGVASVPTQAEAATAAGVHPVVLTGQRVSACCQAASEPAMVLCGG